MLGSKLLHARLISRVHSHLLLRRLWFSSSSSSSFPIDQSFTSQHVASDGRVFQFATVVINNMRKGESALPAWEHACSLVNANPPTLAITFLSKPTDSALAAVRDFAHQFSHGIHGFATSHDHSTHADASCHAGHMDPLRHTHPIDGGTSECNALICDHGIHADASCHACYTDPSHHTHPIDGGTPECNAPVCNAHDNMQDYAPRHNVQSVTPASYPESLPSSTTSIPPSTDYSASMPTLLADENTQLASVPPLIGCMVPDQERVPLTTSIIKANTETGDDLLWLDAPDDKGNDPSPGSEEGNVGSRIGGDKSGVVGDSPGEDPVKEGRMQIGRVPGMQPLHHQAVHITLTGRTFEDEDLVAQSQESNSKASSRSRADIHYVCRQQQEPAKNARRTVGSGNEVPEVHTTQKTLFKHTGDDRSQNDNETTHDRDKSVIKEDETYRLSLCVANMPGVKATGFYTRTAGLPWLPDLANAVTTNNPHMLLLSAPGFNVAEFNQRLACMFPNGSRAGASLLTINDGKIKGSRDDKAAQIFCGLKLASTGAVGLSLSPAGEEDFIPVDAFAEFVRMSLGMPHGSCWDIYFDEAVCKSLFLPQTGKVEWLDTFQRAYRVIPDSVLDKMYTKLHSEYRDASSSNEPRPQLSEAESEKLSIISVDKILFPGFFIPLFIENPCDRLMVRQCMEESRPFGVSSLCTETFFDPVDCRDIVGTIANMKVNLFDKGCKSYIIAHGVRRFRVKNRRLDMQPGTFGQLAGQVEFLDDVKCEDDIEEKEVMELANRALNLCQHLFPFAASILSPGKPFRDPIIASFAISHILPVSVKVKRRWLGMVNTKYRLIEQITFLNA